MTSPRRPDPRDGAALDDAALSELITQAIELGDPVPEHVLHAARGAMAWRTIDQELADLVFDSSAELTGVRDHDSARQLTFRSDATEVELMLVDETQRRIVGQIVPARETTVTLESTEATDAQTSDRFGRFSFDGVHTGPVRLAISGTDDAADIVTDWVNL